MFSLLVDSSFSKFKYLAVMYKELGTWRKAPLTICRVGISDESIDER